MAKGGGKAAAVQNYKQKVAKRAADLDPSESHSKLWYFTVVVLAVLFSGLNTVHLSTLFENDRHFSHLADFEREMAYRTEMGLYFSYYKTLITAPTFLNGLYEITHDNVTEYGHTINTLKRFNLYPEVTLGFLYRQFRAIADGLGWRVEICWQVNRGEGFEPVQGCEGIGNSHYFYINWVFLIAGTVAGALFILGTLLSDSIWGGLVSVLFFFFNHGESTRVQWTPPLRESFSYPIIIAQIALVTHILKSQRSGWTWILLLNILTVPAMLSWQFAQFAFFTQICSLFAVFSLDYCPFPVMKTITLGHLSSFFISFVLLFGNEMLLASLYFPAILSILTILFLDLPLQKISCRPLYLFISLCLFLGGTLSLKYLISKGLSVEDDAHIFEILKSKFSDFANFHTRLYTCAAEFDFIQTETLQKLSKTILLPAGAFGAFVMFFVFILNESLLWRDVNGRNSKNPEILFNVVQGVCFTTMAVLIMRLKLFFTPHLAALSAVVLNSKFLHNGTSIRLSNSTRIGIAVAMVAAAAFTGVGNLKQQLFIHGEYSNPDQEMLFDWINANTKNDAVFAGTMPVMANVKLSTGRPIVNHPHYEDVGIRERTLKVYSMFSRKPLQTVYDTLKELGVEYFVFQMMNCHEHPTKPHCSYRSMWDLQDPENAKRSSLCDAFSRALNNRGEGIAPFKVVYHRTSYTVFKL